MRFGTMLGGAFLVVGILFAAIDSIILFKGWAAYGLDYWDKLSYGTAAASIPWTIVGFPFVFWLMWLRGRWRSVFPIAVAAAVYLILVAYSLIGAMGSIATQRATVIAERKGALESVDSLKDQRNRYRNELGWVQKHRPFGQVAAAIEGEKVKRQWELSDGCRNINGGWQRKFCTDLSALQGELAAARKSEELHKKISALSASIDGRGPVTENADPMAATLTLWLNKFGFSIAQAEASIGLPIATPLVLLIGEMVFVWFGFIALGLNHGRLAADMNVSRLSSATASMREAVAHSPALPPPIPKRDPVVAGRQLASWFFSECTRPVASGGLPEEQWYALYRAECAKSNDTPIGVEAFRAIAQKHGAVVIIVDGKPYYQRVLPLVPKEGAA